jgi:hypothetical protein
VTHPASSRRRVATASAVGATMEWYECFVYGPGAGVVFDELGFYGVVGPAPCSRSRRVATK